MCGGQKATLNAGLYLLSLIVHTPRQLAHKLLGILPSHLGSTRTEEGHRRTGFLWLSRPRLSSSSLHVKLFTHSAISPAQEMLMKHRVLLQKNVLSLLQANPPQPKVQHSFLNSMASVIRQAKKSIPTGPVLAEAPRPRH